ncbi:transcriptional regulator [Sphingomonas sp. JC676]|uniref:winged helix-turn-helix domain-containing protein n=1 Tax=Sphingomonas sp. JC676 TaxID=2768065 RepID=UPI0016577455|nr:transcriptional regulator [Sphingomonas sp. JC676]MBC9034225.1 transcriptional regulator [Sphingomonas sp. JC676]
MSEGPDEVVHQSTRLRILAALDAEPDQAPLDFSRLKSVLGTTDGNLGAHLGTLEKAGYVSVDKQAVGKRTRTLVAITAAGRTAFLSHLAFLKSIVDQSRIGGR